MQLTHDHTLDGERPGEPAIVDVRRQRRICITS